MGRMGSGLRRMQSMDDIVLRAVDKYFIMVEKAGFSGPVFLFVLFS